MWTLYGFHANSGCPIFIEFDYFMELFLASLSTLLLVPDNVKKIKQAIYAGSMHYIGSDADWLSVLVPPSIFYALSGISKSKGIP